MARRERVPPLQTAKFLLFDVPNRLFMHCDSKTCSTCLAEHSHASVSLVVPVKNGGERWQQVIRSIQSQNIHLKHILIIDSGSSDLSDKHAREAGFHVVTIDSRSFDHGGTRQMAVDMLADSDIIAFLTQDAILKTPDTLGSLVCYLCKHPNAGVAYGRQVPRPTARAIERHARLFNYPPGITLEKKIEHAERLGIKTAFSSDSLAVYRRDRLMAAGGFPRQCLTGEDAIVAARILIHGGSVLYVHDAEVEHSHDLTVIQEWRRYFAIGRLHTQESAILSPFKEVSKEGRKFVASEMRYLLTHAPLTIPEALFRTGVKYLAYRAGQLTTKRLAAQ